VRPEKVGSRCFFAAIGEDLGIRCFGLIQTLISNCWFVPMLRDGHLTCVLYDVVLL
jgi:hypothetical protein